MAASLRPARPVAKAVLPNRVGRLGHRLSEPILTTKARPGILLSPTSNLSRGRARLAEHARLAAAAACAAHRFSRAGARQAPALPDRGKRHRRTQRAERKARKTRLPDQPRPPETARPGANRPNLSPAAGGVLSRRPAQRDDQADERPGQDIVARRPKLLRRGGARPYHQPC